MSPMPPVIPAGAPTQGGQLETRAPQIQPQHQQQIFEAAVAEAAREREQQQILQPLLRTYEQQQQLEPMSFNGGFDLAAAGGSSQHQSFEAQQLAAAPVAAREQLEILQPYEEQLLEYPSQLQTQQWEPNDYNLLTQLKKLDEHNQRAQSLIDEKLKGKRVADH
ncbi:hypothetical protein FH972_003978 [Carpinus fangiana]|uniref:Uncharacterized protein n=1 Tax=Carpinus fangiana TaxID=176857 RepID=A0A5N6QJX2_9ROSI|nr:hypothetical protein FH972_003978 [Carpinus fangiana]